MAFAGERFVLDLDDDDDTNPPVDPSPPPAFSLIGEIQERAPSAGVPPAPKPPSGVGFPQHRRRTKPSSFKQRRNQTESTGPSQSDSRSPPSRTPPTLNDDKKAIDEENRRQLDSMPASQLQHEREELMSSMGSSLLERFLRRANIDDEPEPPTEKQEPQPTPPSTTDTQKPKKSVSFDVSSSPAQSPAPKPKSQNQPQPPQPPINEDMPPPEPPADLQPASELPSDTVHFPTPPRHQNPVPNLDPNSPNFLTDLQTHYFPNISHDPTSLEWLQPPSASTSASAEEIPDPSTTSPYDPTSTAESIAPSSLRFSLLGTLLAPSTSLSLPTTLGLHHHGKDPQAAGYTIPELGILGRSSFPAQRCIAWQVLGRILYRLGKGEFGERGGTLVEGLWFVVEKEKLVAAMLAEAEGAGGGSQVGKRRGGGGGGGGEKDAQGGVPGGFGKHASATAWAVEGVWLWQMGGGGDRGLLKEGVVRSQ